MSGSVAYLDSSAFVKLVVAEAESEQLQSELVRWPRQASADLLRTEVQRALRRAGRVDLVGPARRLTATLDLIRLDSPLLDRAGELEPSALRSLGAVHLAAALTLGPDLGALFTYDDRLREAATLAGMDVRSPGA